MHNIRLAKTSEAEKLTNLAIRSEAYWGYNDVFMDKFKEIYKVTEHFIDNNPTFVICENDEVIGFYAIIISKEKNELEYFYIEPQLIGKGYGQALWNHLIDYCKGLKIKDIQLVTSPQAKEFYQRMGAVQIGEVQSLLQKGRIIPKLRYQFWGS